MIRSSWSNPSSASQPAPRILTMCSSRIASASGPGAGAAAAGGGGAGAGAGAGGAAVCGGGAWTQANNRPDNRMAALFPFMALLLSLERFVLGAGTAAGRQARRRWPIGRGRHSLLATKRNDAAPRQSQEAVAPLTRGNRTRMLIGEPSRRLNLLATRKFIRSN